MKSISIIGGGPSALLLAYFLDAKKYTVTIYEKNKTLGRKFLVAGNGGFNLTHSEPIEQMIKRYTPHTFLKDALLNFTNTDLVKWLNQHNIQTFVGSSNRIYPKKEIKPITVLNTIIENITTKNVTIKTNYNWLGWDKNNNLQFENKAKIKSDIVVFALGGGSWKVTGSNTHWLETFTKKSIQTKEFKPSNCAYKVNWNSLFIENNEGEPLKNIAIKCADSTQKGEVVITKFGLEGNAIYALSPQIRLEIEKNKKAEILIDLKPNLSVETIIQKINNSTFKKMNDILKKDLKLSSTQRALVKFYVSKNDFLNTDLIANKLKKLPIEIIDTEILDKAISTVGGIDLNAINKSFELKKIENHYCIGEMLDWDAPTGGYLLQACFSMGVYLAKQLNSE